MMSDERCMKKIKNKIVTEKVVPLSLVVVTRFLIL